MPPTVNPEQVLRQRLGALGGDPALRRYALACARHRLRAVANMGIRIPAPLWAGIKAGRPLARGAMHPRSPILDPARTAVVPYCSGGSLLAWVARLVSDALSTSPSPRVAAVVAHQAAAMPGGPGLADADNERGWQIRLLLGWIRRLE